MRLRRAADIWKDHDADRLEKVVDETYVADSDTIPAPVTGRGGLREFSSV